MSPTSTATTRVSVAMCTYNGAAYVEAQLQSILDQDRAVDEIIVSDDGSTDNTVDRVRQLLAGASVQWWHFGVADESGSQHLGGALASQRARGTPPPQRLLRLLRVAPVALSGGHVRYADGLRSLAKDLLAGA